MKEADKMTYDLSEVKKMFADADNIIKERPELSSTSIDQIFEELGRTPDMKNIRWGIMTRVKMSEIKEYTSDNIISFMMNITEYNLLCEYIGYVLQTEHHISLIKLIIEAYEKNVHNEVLPFVESCLEYEEDCCIDKIDIILDIIGVVDDAYKSRLVRGYGLLVLKTDSEEFIFEKYLKNYSEALERLVMFLIGKLYPKKEELAKKWTDRYMEEEKTYCKKAGIYLLRRSTIYDVTIFESYFEKLEELWGIHDYWEHLIGTYVQYIESEGNMLYKNEVKERLIRVKDGSLDEKINCVQEIYYRINKVNEYIEIIENILDNSFDKDRRILTSVDYYFNYMLDKNFVKAVDVLHRVYEINEFVNDDEYLKCLPQTCLKLKQNQDELLDIWWYKFLHGSKADFFLTVEMFQMILSPEKLENFLCNKGVSKEDALLLLEGIFLFTIDENKIVNLAFIIAACVKDNEFFPDYCIENIFVNYPGALVDAAKNHVDSENIYKKALAKYIVDYYDMFDKKIRKGYEDKDFVPSSDRQMVYKKFMVEQNEKIIKNANEQSFFADIFPIRKMKYGRRIAYLQTYGRRKYNYDVSEYAINTFSVELPKCFINDPMKYIYMRTDYMKEREKNAINS